MENDTNKKEPALKREYMKVFIEMSGWIVIPVICALVIGKWLDTKWGTTPWILITGLALSFITSMIRIVKMAKRFDTEILKEKDGDN